MGLRMSKSINLGGGFRINLSKSGVGYSWGVKGYRITKTAKGKIRRTVSIPGTGIAWVDEKNSKEQPNNKPIIRNPIDNNHYDTVDINNSCAASLISEGLEDLLSIANRTLRLNSIATYGIVISLLLSIFNPVFLVFTILSICTKVYVKHKGIVDLEYTIEEDQKEIVEARINPMIAVTKSNKTWRIIQTSKVIDKKYAAGASNTIKRINTTTSTVTPFPFKSNMNVATFKTGKETLIFLPDKLFVIQGTKVGALSYSDISSNVYSTKFIESEAVPTDALIIDYTWKYVNKSGGPDKRFKDNKKLPVCNYGEIELKSHLGLNTVLLYSNINIE